MEQRFDRRFSAIAASILLSGCGFSNGIPAPAPAARLVRANASSGTLLYVANVSATSGVDILTFPHGRHVGTISGIGAPEGVCADRSGHVWITASLNRRTSALYEFARGATTPLRTVRKKTLFGPCVVDPHGDVAVLTSFVGSAGAVETWPPSLNGKPNVIEIPLFPASGAYDGQGNLYLTGVGNSDPTLGVLPSGSTKFTWLRLSKRYDIAYGCLGWDGTYVTLATHANGSIIARLKIQGRIAKIASTVHLSGFAWTMQYALGGTEIVAQNGDSIALYKYPEGGKQKRVFPGFSHPLEMAISAQ